MAATRILDAAHTIIGQRHVELRRRRDPGR
jgi:hypothetical protein